MFEAGQEVAWSHIEATKHAAGSVLLKSALPPGTPVGTVVKAANEPQTWWEVSFQDRDEDGEPVGDPTSRVLTSDELVRVAEG